MKHYKVEMIIVSADDEENLGTRIEDVVDRHLSESGEGEIMHDISMYEISE